MTKTRNGRLDFKQRIAARAEELAELLFALLAIAVWFVAVFLIAVGLGWFLHYAGTNFTWVSKWMLGLGEFLEKLIFIGDFFSLAFAVAKELWSHVIEPIVVFCKKNLRKNGKKQK